MEYQRWPTGRRSSLLLAGCIRLTYLLCRAGIGCLRYVLSLSVESCGIPQSRKNCVQEVESDSCNFLYVSWEDQVNLH